MSQINISNLTFSYNGSYDTIFKHVSFCIDTNWKLGFIGRNGKGKTTFFHLLMGKYDYSGHISSNVTFEHFPYDVKDKSIFQRRTKEKSFNCKKFMSALTSADLG